MASLLLKFLKNDLVYWIFILVLSLVVGLYILKKEGVKITISFGPSYGNKVLTIGE